jgi:hypothetical protein
MWPITVAFGFLIAYLILKFAGPIQTSLYLPGASYYKSEPKVTGSPLPVDNALVGVGLETRVTTKPSVMDSGAPAKMVMMAPAPAPAPAMAPGPMMAMAPAPSPMMDMAPAPSPMMAPSPAPAPSPMMAMGNAPVTMTPVPSPAPAPQPSA